MNPNLNLQYGFNSPTSITPERKGIVPKAMLPNNVYKENKVLLVMMKGHRT